MTSSALAINLLVGVLFTLIWGLLVNIAAERAEFKSLFLGGLANFVFYAGGLFASYLSQGAIAETPSPTLSTPRATPHLGDLNLLAVIGVAFATTGGVLLLNTFMSGLTDAVYRMRTVGSVYFTDQGYRDIQLYVGGMLALLCCGFVLVFTMYLGAQLRDVNYRSALAGSVLSVGTLGALYLLFGVFFNYQAFQVLRLSVPDVLLTYGPFISKLFQIIVTATVLTSSVLAWSLAVWASMGFGALTRRWLSS